MVANGLAAFFLLKDHVLFAHLGESVVAEEAIGGAHVHGVAALAPQVVETG